MSTKYLYCRYNIARDIRYYGTDNRRRVQKFLFKYYNAEEHQQIAIEILYDALPADMLSDDSDWIRRSIVIK